MEVRSALQDHKHDMRLNLGDKMAKLEAERLKEAAAGAARRTASADRVREQAGFHVIRSSFAESIRQRNEDAKAMRKKLKDWEDVSTQRRTLSAQLGGGGPTMSFLQVERQKHEVDALKQKVPDFDELRSHLKLDLDRKKREAAEVRHANECVENEAKEVRLNSARAGKARTTLSCRTSWWRCRRQSSLPARAASPAAGRQRSRRYSRSRSCSSASVSTPRTRPICTLARRVPPPSDQSLTSSSTIVWA